MSKKKNTVSKRTPQDDIELLRIVRDGLKSISVTLNELEDSPLKPESYLDGVSHALTIVKNGLDMLNDVKHEEINDEISLVKLDYNTKIEMLKLITFTETLERRFEILKEKLRDRVITNEYILGLNDIKEQYEREYDVDSEVSKTISDSTKPNQIPQNILAYLLNELNKGKRSKRDLIPNTELVRLGNNLFRDLNGNEYISLKGEVANFPKPPKRQSKHWKMLELYRDNFLTIISDHLPKNNF